MVDTCGGEFEAETPYFYSTYEPSGETLKLAGRKVLIVGSGPIRIGQGVEFDYCCVQGSSRCGKGRRCDHRKQQSRDRLDGF